MSHACSLAGLGARIGVPSEAAKGAELFTNRQTVPREDKLSVGGGRRQSLDGSMRLDAIGEEAEPCARIPPMGGILDDSGPCARFYGPSDSWRNVGEAGHEGNLHWTYAFDDPDPSNWAQWLAHFEEAGEHEVEVHLLAAYAQSQQARYRVRHAGQDTDEVLDMSASEGWRSLGTYPFEAGGDQFVAMYDNTGEALSDQRMIMFDAVRFRRQIEPDPVGEAGTDATPVEDAGRSDVMTDVVMPNTGKADGGTSAQPKAWSGNDDADGCACSSPSGRGPDRGSLVLVAMLGGVWVGRRGVHGSQRRSDAVFPTVAAPRRPSSRFRIRSDTDRPDRSGHPIEHSARRDG